MDFTIYNSSQSLALGLGIVDVVRPMSHLRRIQRWASRLCYNKTYATWRGLHFAPPRELYSSSVRTVLCITYHCVAKVNRSMFQS